MRQEIVEFFGVVVVHGVGEFVHDDVVYYLEREEDEFPVEVEIVAVRAAAPAGFLGADGDGAVMGTHDIADFFEAFGEVDFEFFS